MHIHVRKGSQLAKFWIHPFVHVSESYGFTAQELARLAKIIKSRTKEIEESWNEYFGI